MNTSIFITGITGFLGKSLLRKINPEQYNKVYFLIRNSESELIKTFPENFIPVIGDLHKPESYEKILAEMEIDTVIHLASVTGKVSPQEYEEVIVKGTKNLLEKCKENKVNNIIYLSSIAAKFEKIKRYHYGLAKKKAENIIANGGLNYSIIRPTMILGENSAVFEGFSNLANLPVIPVFGKGNTMLQPIDVEDVSNIIISILEADNCNNKIIEIAGPNILSINDFLKKIRVIKNNNHDKSMRFFHIPMGLTVLGLTAIESFAYNSLPITIGQLASFRNDSTINNTSVNFPYSKSNIKLTDIDTMIKSSLKSNGNSTKKKSNNKGLIRECKTFCKYLSGLKANGYVIENYIKYHNISNLENKKDKPFFDKFLIKLASLHPLLTKPIDIYTKFLKPQTVLRYKLSYLLAILEVSPPYYKNIETTEGIEKYKFLLLLVLKGGVFGVQLLVSIILLLPFDLFFKLINKSSKGGKNV